MIWLRRRLHLDRLGDDRGMALAIAVVFGTVIVFMVSSAVAVATSGIRKSVSDADWNSALSAAYAGVQDYEARLSNDTGYTQYGNPAAPFSASSAALLTLPTGGAANKAFGTGAGGDWATVQGGDGRASYRYEVDSSKYYSSGIVRIRATGKVGKAVRSVVASVRQQGFVDFLYFTDYEIQDPVMTGANPTDCVKYAWQNRPVAAYGSNQCGEIAFGGNDTIDGPAHSNDTMRICDATFTGQVTTSNPRTTGLRYNRLNSYGGSCSGQQFPPGVTQPGFTSTIDMPATNAAQKSATRSDQGAGRQAGCLYTGPTNIVFNANGTMTVKSPYTSFTETAGDGSTSGSNTNGCGMPGTATGRLGSSAGATVPVPDNNLIYVQNVPSATSDKNGIPESTLRTACNTGNGVGYPAQNENVLSTSPCSYGTRSGDAFVKGTLQGKVTVAAENYIYVTGDLTYQDSSSDVLGLTATNAIQVWNPITSTSCGWQGSSRCYSSLLQNDGREIDAAMISAAHTVQVQNSNYGGSRGTLKIVGAIAQKFRGVVNTGGNGYVKNYVYDARLKHTAPPKFLNPVTTTYGITSVGEVSAAYSLSGDCSRVGGVCV
jgi:hypothetical protein